LILLPKTALWIILVLTFLRAANSHILRGVCERAESGQSKRVEGNSKVSWQRWSEMRHLKQITLRMNLQDWVESQLHQLRNWCTDPEKGRPNTEFMEMDIVSREAG
jgi:hypothetical protein